MFKKTNNQTCNDVIYNDQSLRDCTCNWISEWLARTRSYYLLKLCDAADEVDQSTKRPPIQKPISFELSLHCNIHQNFSYRCINL